MSQLRWADRVGILRSTAVNRILQEARQLQASGRSLISLMRGQPDIPTPAFIVEAANQALREGRTGYPDNLGEPLLRQAVAEKLRRDNDLMVDPDQEILISDGATSGIFAALGALIQPGAEVLLPDPIYDAYMAPIALWGGQPIPVRSSIRKGRYGLDRDALEEACTPRTRVLLINTPWNPTGTVLAEVELSTCIDFACEHHLWILSDEIYESLVYDGRRHLSPSALSPEARRRTVLINSLSKTYAMTGWRVGYCAGPAELIQKMYLVLQQYSRGPALFVQHAAACALRAEPQGVQSMTDEFQKRRDQVVQALHGLPGIEPLIAEGGLFVMLDVRALGIPSQEVSHFLMHEAGVVVIHGSAYGAGGEGMLRISFAAGGTPLQQGLERLRTGLRRLYEKTHGKADA